MQIASIMTLYKYPQYYSVIDEHGQMAGRILARFYLIPKLQNTSSNDREKNIMDKMRAIAYERDFYNISLSVIGLRNLVSAQKDSWVQVSFTNHVAGEFDAEDEIGNEGRATQLPAEGEDLDCEIVRGMTKKITNINNDAWNKNPNFGKMLKFVDCEFATEPLLWPFLKVELIDS